MPESLSRLGASLVIGLDASSRVVEVAKAHSSSSSLFHHYQHNNVDKSNMIDGEGGKEGRTQIRYIGGMTVEEFASRWPNLISDKDELNEEHNQLVDLQSLLSSSSFDISSIKHNHDEVDERISLTSLQHLRSLNMYPIPPHYCRLRQRYSNQMGYSSYQQLSYIEIIWLSNTRGGVCNGEGTTGDT